MTDDHSPQRKGTDAAVDLTDPHRLPLEMKQWVTGHVKQEVLLQDLTGRLKSTNVAAGATGQVLTSSGGTTGWATPVAYANASGGATNTDLPWSWGSAQMVFMELITSGGGTMRSLGAAPNLGVRFSFRNFIGTAITIKHNTAGGTGIVFVNRSGADIILAANETVEYVYVGSWVEVTRDVAVPTTLTGQITTTGTITTGTGFTCARNSAGNYTITYTTAFAAAPVVTATVLANQPVAIDLISTAAGSCNIAFSVASTGVFQDQNFQFLVTQML